jgi:Ca2+-binding RTX toxin-like protein
MTTLDDNPNQLDLNLPGLGPDTIFAGAGADFVRTATLGGSLIFGQGDNDTLLSVGPNDTLYGGNDEDSIRAQRSPALLFGDAGSDTVVAEARATLYGGAGEDFLQGTVESNLMFGNEDSDTMLGGAQRRDSLYGGKGNDSIGFFIAGGNNNLGLPLFVTGFAGNEGSNWLRGDLGDDLVAGINQRDTLYGGRGNDSLRTVGSNSYASGDNDNDTLWAVNSTSSNVFGAGVIVTGLERITLLGGAGNDSLYGAIGEFGSGRNLFDGGEGSDTIFAFASQDTALGGSGNDFIQSKATDVLSSVGARSSFPGYAGRSLLDGGAGDDTITAAFSTDTMIGGEGNDSLSGIFTSASGAEGNDTINASFAGTSAAFITLDGGLGNDFLLGNTTASATFTTTNFFNGGEGDDRIFLSSLRDRIIGNAAGNDTIAFATTASFTGTAVSVITDTLGSNFITGGNSTDVITTGGGDDILFGGTGTITGVFDNDTLDAGGGNDTILGGFGNDVLIGGDGNDSLGGGPGADTLTGGSGNDSFYYANFGEGFPIGVNNFPINSTTVGPDQIGDFTPGQDKLVFRRDGFPGISGNNSPAFESFLLINSEYRGGVNPPGASATQPFIFYQINDGRLGFDPDGSAGPNPGVTLAILNNRPTLNASDITLI